MLGEQCHGGTLLREQCHGEHCSESNATSAAAFPGNDERFDVGSVDASIEVDIRGGVSGFPDREEGLDVGAVGTTIAVEVAQADTRDRAEQLERSAAELVAEGGGEEPCVALDETGRGTREGFSRLALSAMEPPPGAR